MSTLNAALSGANLIVLHGSVYGEYTYHPVCAVLDDDIATWVGRVIEGFEVNDETLALDLIDEVGPIPGSYLDKPHTRAWWRSQQFIPGSADRSTYPEWIRSGKKTALHLAGEKLGEILRSHRVEPLRKDADRALDEILKEAEEYYGEKGLL
jgi:trimethylamine--corrinoid protein Co-methyltransferase